MLAEFRRAAQRHLLACNARQLHRRARDLDIAARWIGAVDERAALSDLGVGYHLFDLAHRSAWHAGLDEYANDVIATLGLRPRGNHLVEFVSVLHPRAMVFVFEIGNQLFMAHQLREGAPMCLGENHDQRFTVAGRINIRRAYAPMPIAEALELPPLQDRREDARER